MALNKPCPVQTSRFQFQLRHLFLLIFLHSVYFALVRWTGPFVATLLVGPFIQIAIVVLLRIENMIWGAIIGTALAILFLVIVALAFGPIPTEQIVAVCLVYPIFGYLCGVLCAADRQLRLGL